jgi:hypothetical protein
MDRASSPAAVASRPKLLPRWPSARRTASPRWRRRMRSDGWRSGQEWRRQRPHRLRESCAAISCRYSLPGTAILRRPSPATRALYRAFFAGPCEAGSRGTCLHYDMTCGTPRCDAIPFAAMTHENPALAPGSGLQRNGGSGRWQVSGWRCGRRTVMAIFESGNEAQHKRQVCSGA